MMTSTIRVFMANGPSPRSSPKINAQKQMVVKQQEQPQGQAEAEERCL
jgi:hypothetical protein